MTVLSEQIPKYRQLKKMILDSLKNGELKPGMKVASENELAAKYDVSKDTSRKALTELVCEGVLYRIQGKGTFVAEKTSVLALKNLALILNESTMRMQKERRECFGNLINGISSVASLAGYSIIQCERHLQELPSGAVIINPHKNALLVEELDARKIPWITPLAFSQENVKNCVWIDRAVKPWSTLLRSVTKRSGL